VFAAEACFSGGLHTHRVTYRYVRQLLRHKQRNRLAFQVGVFDGLIEAFIRGLEVGEFPAGLGHSEQIDFISDGLSINPISEWASVCNASDGAQ
jgi:hypothetical protein